MGKNQVNIRVHRENWDELQALVKALGWPKNWLSCQIDEMVAGLLVVAKQAIQDAQDQKEMTEAEAKKRYEDLMRTILDTK